MQKHLVETGIRQDQIIAMNFESMEYRDMDVQAFYNHVKGKILPEKKMYLFFDELQRLEKWEDAVNSFRVDFNCDIYITGSNAYLLSSEYSTYLGGRYVEIRMLPLSFRKISGNPRLFNCRDESARSRQENQNIYSCFSCIDP